MRDASRPFAATARRIAAGLLAAALIGGVLPPAPAPIRAARPHADDPHADAAAFLARRDGNDAASYRVVYERQARTSAGEALWVGKLVNASTGRIEIVYRDGEGRLGGPELYESHQLAAAAALSPYQRKASDALRAAVSRRGLTASAGRLPVAAWLDVDLDAAEQAVMDRHPEVSWSGNRPISNDLATIRRLRGELWSARRGAVAAAAEQLRVEVERLGGRLAYVSRSAPLAFIDLPPSAVQPLAEAGVVESMGLEGAWSPSMSAAGRAVEGNWTSGSGDRGAGIRVGVVEYHNVRRGGDLADKVVRSHSTSGTLRYSGGFDHPTWVAGAVAGQNATYRGVAPGAVIVSSGTGGYNPSVAYDRYIIQAADWAVSPGGGNVDIVNTSLAQDTSTGSEEARRYFDSIVDRDGRLAVSAAGNYVNFNGWQIASPGTGYNVLTVGGVDDRGTASRTDDRIWYVPGSNGSNWLDRPSDPWNAHGDFNKPNLVAPAVGVRTANGLAASGTSVATPIVAGVAAQVLSNEPLLAAWPEGARAVLMAGAVHRVRMPNGSRNVDHEGVGMTSALWTNRVAHAGDNQLGGYRVGTLSPGEEPVQQISVRAGDRLRVALAWNSHTGGSGNLSLHDTLRADLDLRVVAPNGQVSGSYTLDNAYEFVEVVMPSSGVARLEVRQARFDGSQETYGLAWAKVRDASRPSVTLRVPKPGEPWVVPSGRMRVTFSEPVSGVSNASFKLKRVSNGNVIGASVGYHGGSRTATLRPSHRLGPGRYEAILRSSITDAAGNHLPRRAWRFSVARPVADTDRSFGTPRRLRFRPGTHVGYGFDGTGAVTGSESRHLSTASGALVDRRATIPGKPGIWLHVTNGAWANRWIRESGRAGLRGFVSMTEWGKEKRVVIAAGTHVGRHFHDGGRTISRREMTAGSKTSATARRRAVINGAWHLKITSGRWSGYWLPESGAIHVRGMRVLTDLEGARVTVGSGARTGHRYRSSGTRIASRRMALSQGSGAPVSAWGIINGRPAFYVTSGGWAGYWLPESAGAHIP